MCFPHTGRSHEQQTFFRRSWIIPHKSLRQQLGLLHRLAVLRGPGLPVGKVGDVALEIAVLVPLRDVDALHHASGASLHAAIAGDGYTPTQAISTWPELPAGSPAQRAIFNRHEFELYRARPAPAGSESSQAAAVSCSQHTRQHGSAARELLWKTVENLLCAEVYGRADVKSREPARAPCALESGCSRAAAV